MDKVIKVPELEQPSGALTEQIKPNCGNCRFAQMIPKDFKRVECHWGPPMASMVPVMTQAAPQLRAQHALQQFVSFPAVQKDWHCHQHERKITN